MHGHFDLGGLGKHVEGSNGDDGEASLQFGEIAREGGGIARDVNHGARRRIDNCAAQFGGKTGGGRIDDQRRVPRRINRAQQLT